MIIIKTIGNFNCIYMTKNNVRIATFKGETDPNKSGDNINTLDKRINEFMSSYDNNPLEYIEIIETKHHTTDNKWNYHIITVMITYKIQKESD